MHHINRVLVLARTYAHKGNQHYDKKNYAQAISAYNQSLALNPKVKTVYNNRGAALYKQGKLQEAISDFSQALILDQNYVEAYYNRGYVYYDLKQFRKSISDCNQALAMNPECLLAYFTRGCAYHAKGMTALTISDFMYIWMTNPDKFETIYSILTNIVNNLNENETLLHAVINELNDTKKMQLLAMCLNKNNPIGKIYYNNERFLKFMADRIIQSQLHNKYFIDEIKKINDVDTQIILLKTFLDNDCVLGKQFKNSPLLMEMITLLRKLNDKCYITYTYETERGVITKIGFFDKPKPKPIQVKENVVEEVENAISLFNNL